MMHAISTDGLALARAPMMTLSDDGLIRLTVEALRTIPFIHLLSGLDEHNGSPPTFEGASLDPISGYTEWVSTTSPVITLGWDWWLDASAMPFIYTHVGEPRSNVMIEDAQHRDLGRRKTDATLETLISTLSWQAAVAEHIRSRYA
ncbi:conserved hypothetical protein [Thiomonas arsenitoxydans]|jgi:hypothetical protein|uniref:DUF4902 domain-containing protein n=1 Tax=Thiomonas arsenitoxydans (strain DSM 22701 / CIP 110005 / 3As) TaxID=426114 RepID=D6CSX8_THIA3|nr:DUF4902 domain-containing protein [Thiomonas arsenitoxydans]CAZ88397.1 conserved hypothetical protein [Thiomonas arsenitoxydans]CQR33474.1 conserved hypothetical protein [Thiomonas arsenitoxydans]CQR33750.1 conserved hypothetical protein [Thiomonas arsenitoxydans]